MKEKLRNLIKNFKLRRIHALVIVTASVLAVVTIGFFVFYPVSKSYSVNIANDESTRSNNSGDDSLVVAVVGEEYSSIIGNAMSNNSWPGEIISLNNLQVQPDRDGTISEWYVRIGERVYAGQVIGKLSRPPQTPEMVSMLSEKFEDLSSARTSIVALRAYTTKRILQLQQLRTDTENSNKQKIDLLGSNISVSESPLLSLVVSKKKLAQVILRGSITKAFPMMYGQSNIPPLELIFRIQPKPMFGVLDLNVRNNFTNILFKALSDLKDVNIIPEQSGFLYFDNAIKLANASIADTGTLTETDLALLKKMLVEDQSEFVIILGEIKNMELESVNTRRESIDTLAEIDAMIAELEKELAISEGELIAKETAYTSVKGSITLGYSIVAPNSGVVSSIMKKPGEFVGPGMPVATVTAEVNDNKLVRMRIPNNVQKPKIGELLSIVRPGFGTDVQKARFVGVGSSLDNDGSYMADAVFTESTKWSIGASVRVLASVSSSAVLIKHSSVLWGEGDVPTVWAVSEAGRIFAKKITIGRILGASIEVYEGLKNGDRYIINPTQNFREDMLLSDIIKTPTSKDGGVILPAKSDEHENMPGM